jgi:outer membrane lipoprotein SlyB
MLLLLMARRSITKVGETTMYKSITLSVALVFSSILAGCASHGPVLYPNAHLKTVGEEQAQRDIAGCQQMAGEYVKSNPGGDVAKSTVVGGAGGAVVGAAVGAVTGNFGQAVGAWAAGGAAGGLFYGLLRGSEPSPVHKGFVDRCLREKGYEPMGWK